jgi:hypothetical protein
MYKSKLRIFGQTSLVIGLFGLVILMTLWTTIGYDSLEQKEKLFMRLGWPSLGFLILFLGYRVFFEINQITIDDTKIEIQNLISRRTKEIKKKDLKGYKDKFSNGYSLLLLDNMDKVVAKVSDPYYKDFKSLRDNLGLPYLGRIPTFWDKIIRVEIIEDEK